MKILAMDLSLSCPAFAVLTVNDIGTVDVEHLSHLKTNTKKSHGYRLFQIYKHMKNILKEHDDITDLVRERGFSRFPSVTQALFKVVGISDLCAITSGFSTVNEVTPTTVKKAITGKGKATKDEVAINVSTFISTNIKFNTDDESDAVAVGVTYLKQKKALA
ncbi:crossover junction endodeoxyribonuclease RuvC [Priestia megaterium]|uniref:crossover junction endodeoxyribonuclease RuvC n=1 Tax=Priestia megaterium TaxID=1404 RepID=UPI0023DB29FF|nr:crossover junction endodeoxyribonuclease RuvC [Priestia megaterium]MDF2010244.1 crossover junction endodeoxyribonuclease RuvC [Priestia megaterium]